MELIIKENRARFDANVIKAGYAIYGKHASWDEGKTGIVTLPFLVVIRMTPLAAREP